MHWLDDTRDTGASELFTTRSGTCPAKTRAHAWGACASAWLDQSSISSSRWIDLARQPRDTTWAVNDARRDMFVVIDSEGVRVKRWREEEGIYARWKILMEGFAKGRFVANRECKFCFSIFNALSGRVDHRRLARTKLFPANALILESDRLRRSFYF